MPDLAYILKRILEVRSGLHTAGTLSPAALESIAELCQEQQASAETGCGASTLLFSHASARHLVFAAERGNDSLQKTRSSHLLRSHSVRFIEGPTQLTLPKHEFERPLQFVLLDGPHGYPFPQLEYYFFYAHLERGGILAIDDIQIPTVHNLYRFLQRDQMFDLERVAGTTAFFRRTDAPLFDPLGDGWWEQGFNRRPLLRYTWRERLRRAAPISRRRLRSRFRQVFGRWGAAARIEIQEPRSGGKVGLVGEISGTAALPSDAHLWILVRQKGAPGWWPQGEGPAEVEQGAWRMSACYGEASDSDSEYEICAVVVGGETHRSWLSWTGAAANREQLQPVELPDPRYVMAEEYRSVLRAAGNCRL